MVLGFSGWMDGGEISTGTVRYLMDVFGAKKFAEIESHDFYIYSFPGSMEVTALFRPTVKIEDGLIRRFRESRNTFYCARKQRLVLFDGKEPNLKWPEFADCIFAVARAMGVKRIYFIGSVAGLVPHTRDPRLFGSVSDGRLRAALRPHGVRFTRYEGPASIATYLLERARSEKMAMVSLVAEIPAYVQGPIPRCMASVVDRLSALLGVDVSLEELRGEAEEETKRLNEIISGRPDLAVQIRQLEENYDKEILDDEMGDLKAWLKRQGIALS